LEAKLKDEALFLLKKYYWDKIMSFCDIISFMVVTKVLKNIPCLAFDDGFEKLELINVCPS